MTGSHTALTCPFAPCSSHCNHHVGATTRNPTLPPAQTIPQQQRQPIHSMRSRDKSSPRPSGGEGGDEQSGCSAAADDSCCGGRHKRVSHRSNGSACCPELPSPKVKQTPTRVVMRVMLAGGGVRCSGACTWLQCYCLQRDTTRCSRARRLLPLHRLCPQHHHRWCHPHSPLHLRHHRRTSAHAQASCCCSPCHIRA